jgi:hypothetical protein
MQMDTSFTVCQEMCATDVRLQESRVWLSTYCHGLSSLEPPLGRFALYHEFGLRILLLCPIG